MVYDRSLKERRELILDIRVTAQKRCNHCIYFKSEKWCITFNTVFYVMKVSESDYENSC